LLLTPFSGALLALTLLALTLLALTGMRLLVLPTLSAFVAWVIATLLLTDIGRLVVRIASLLLVCHSKFSCECSRVSQSSFDAADLYSEAGAMQQVARKTNSNEPSMSPTFRQISN
jgi:hypothetical protein